VCPLLCRSILCNSTNNPFGGAGSAADVGNTGAGLGNGGRTGKGRWLLSNMPYPEHTHLLLTLANVPACSMSWCLLNTVLERSLPVIPQYCTWVLPLNKPQHTALSTHSCQGCHIDAQEFGMSSHFEPPGFNLALFKYCQQQLSSVLQAPPAQLKRAPLELAQA